MDKIEIQPYEPNEYREQYTTSGDQFDPQAEVRTYTTAGIRSLLVALKPYIDGTLGDVSPRHARLYLDGLRELNTLWSAKYHRGGVGSLEGEAGIERVTARRQQVLVMLDQLRDRSRG